MQEVKVVLLNDIARALDENVKLNYTIDRLSDHLAQFDDDVMSQMKSNYNDMVIRHIHEDRIILLDNSEIIKKYEKKFEYLCMVRDASSPKDNIFPGYHVCEATAITKDEHHPISLYSHIHSTESEGFRSMNDETINSIKYVKSVIPERCTFVCDRGYDANVFYDYFIDKIIMLMILLSDLKKIERYYLKG